MSRLDSICVGGWLDVDWSTRRAASVGRLSQETP